MMRPRDLVIVVSNALLLLGVHACEDSEPRVAPEAHLVAEVQPFDSVFRLGTSGMLVEDPARPLGQIQDAALDEEGHVVVADFVQRAVHVYDRSGSRLRSIGAFGGGPGEYRTPTAVRVSPFDGSLIVSDLAGGRALVFDPSGAGVTGTLATAALPVSGLTAISGPGGDAVVTGTPKYAFLPESTVVAVRINAAGPTSLPFAHLPRALRGKNYVGNLVHGIVGQTERFVYFGLNAWPTIYRIRYDGSPVDSVRLPQRLFAGAQLPDSQIAGEGFSGLRAYTESQPWLDAIRPVNDSVIIVAVVRYHRDVEEWLREYFVLHWGSVPTARASTPCACQLVGAFQGQVAVIAGTATEGFRLEWRALPVNSR